MARRIPAIGFAAALILLVFAGGTAHAQADMTIVVGERVGPVALGMTEAQLVAAAGQPQQMLMQGRDTLYSWGLVTARIPAGAMGVDEITVNDTRYLTDQRIHVGSTDTAVVASFGQPMKRATVSGLETLDYDGISIVQRNGMVMQIRIRK
jgi:hypothetical protein